MFEIVRLALGRAASYQSFTYRSYRGWLVKPAAGTEAEADAGTGAGAGAEAEADADAQKIILGASFMGRPVGLLLAHPPVEDDPARVLSVFVDKPYRGLGIATALMQELKASLSSMNLEQACVEYYALHSYEALERVLAKSGWQPPSVYSRFYRCDIAAGRDRKWISRFKLPSSCTVIPWNELRRGELSLMNQLQEKDYNAYFMPMRAEGVIERDCSLVLKLDEEIVGWSIVDRQLPETLLYRTLYIREAYRDNGLGLSLAAQSAQRMLRTNASHLVIQILPGNERMQKVANRLLAPMQPVVTDYKRAVLDL